MVYRQWECLFETWPCLLSLWKHYNHISGKKTCVQCCFYQEKNKCGSAKTQGIIRIIKVKLSPETQEVFISYVQFIMT